MARARRAVPAVPRTCEFTEALAAPDERTWLGDVNAFASDLYIADEPEWLRVAEFARDIFGNPSRPGTFDARWRSAVAIRLANGIYSDRAFDRLPILADALEDAGCDDTELLGHSRRPGPHVRGCWVLDLVLGRE